MKTPWKNFSNEELRCKCGHCDSNWRYMDASFMDDVQKLRDDLGFPVIVTSAYRCLQHPIEAKKRKRGTHTYGAAIDIGCSGPMAFHILAQIFAGIHSGRYSFTGVGVQQRGDSRFIHVDNSSSGEFTRPTLWSY
jgi:zinc D-Ala-D-Ala carboxypeptidase